MIALRARDLLLPVWLLLLLFACGGQPLTSVEHCQEETALAAEMAGCDLISNDCWDDSPGIVQCRFIQDCKGVREQVLQVCFTFKGRGS